MSEQPNAAWARYYSAQGFKVIPIHVLINGECSCRRGPDVCIVGKDAGKHPVQSGWQTPPSWATSDAAIMRWWGDPNGIPYSIGLVCGEPSGVWLLDVDPRNGGFESLERLEAEQGESLPDTRVAKTGGGGRHYVFPLPEGLRLKKGPLHKDYPGIDVQTDGSQSVLPPSAHASGKRYEWLTPPDQPIVEAPAWLLKMITGDRGHPGAGLGGKKLDIRKLTENGVPEGQRNDTLMKVATSFARQFGTKTDAERMLVITALEAYNANVCKPPIEHDELKKILASAIGFVDNDQPTLPPGVQEWIAAQSGTTTAAVAAVAPVAPQPEAVVLPEVPAALGAEAREAVEAIREASDATPQTPLDAPASGGASIPPGGGGAPSGGPGGGGPQGGGGGGGPVGPVPPANNFGPGGLPPDNDSLGPDGVVGMRTWTDNGNARRLVDYFPDEVRYTPGFNWYHWSDFTWRPDSPATYPTALTRELGPRIMSEVVNFPNPDDQIKLAKFCEASKSEGSIRKAVKLAETDPRIIVPHTVWDSDTDLIGVGNGVVNLRNGNLIPPARDQYITKRTACDYTPGAKDTRFRIWLEQVTGGDKELQAWLQRWAGYCLTAEVREEKFVMLYGPAGTGKSTFLELIMAVSGDYGLALTAENIMAVGKAGAGGSSEYFVAEIMGRRVIIVSELPEGEMMKEDAIKRLTGADTLMGRPIHKTPVQFKSKAKLLVGTNNRPRVKDPAMWRRMQLVPFLHKPQVMDPSLKPYLLDPRGGLPAFLAWAVEGAVAWFSHGLGKAQVIEEATAEYKEAEDEIGLFLSEELRAGEGLSVSIAEVHNAWRFWQEDRGVQNAGPLNKLLRMLGDRGIEIDGKGRGARLVDWTLAPKAVPSPGQGGFAGMLQSASRYI